MNNGILLLIKYVIYQHFDILSDSGCLLLVTG